MAPFFFTVSQCLDKSESLMAKPVHNYWHLFVLLCVITAHPEYVSYFDFEMVAVSLLAHMLLTTTCAGLLL